MMQNTIWFVTLLALLGSLPAVTHAKPSSPEKPPSKATANAAMRHRVFELVWRTVRDGHYDPKMNGVDWNAVHRRYAPKVAAAKNEAELYALLNTMLSELKQSHLGAISPEAMEDAEGIGSSTKSEGPSGDPGMTVEWIDKQPMVVRVAEGGAAAEAGIKSGYILTAIKGKPILPVLQKLLLSRPHNYPGEERVEIWASLGSLLAGTVGKPLELTMKDETDTEKKVTLTPHKPAGQMVTFGALPPLPAEIETKTLANGVGYIRFSIFLIPLSDPVKDAIRGFAAKNAPGIIIDLRGNRGGIGLMASGISGVLVDKETNLGTMRMRNATLRFPVFPQPPTYTGPVFVLTDEGSISTSEVMAAGLQELHRATIVGRTTAGMVLPSQIIVLPDGGRLQYVQADFRTPKGVLLEGRGVVPDIPINLTRALLLASPSGDPILDAALAQLSPK